MWHLIAEGQWGQNLPFKEFMLDSADDINHEPTDQGPIPLRSVAYLNEDGGEALDQMWMKSTSGQWNPM